MKDIFFPSACQEKNDKKREADKILPEWLRRGRLAGSFRSQRVGRPREIRLKSAKL
jgi:hypothetical protein